MTILTFRGNFLCYKYLTLSFISEMDAEHGPSINKGKVLYLLQPQRLEIGEGAVVELGQAGGILGEAADGRVAVARGNADHHAHAGARQ